MCWSAHWTGEANQEQPIRGLQWCNPSSNESPVFREQGGPRVTVTVVCERLGGRRDDVFTLPVIIHVTDVNDNAPVFVTGPQVLNITEDTPLGTVLTEVS